MSQAKDLTDFLRGEFLAVGMQQSEAARRSGLSANAIHNFTYSKSNASLHTLLGIAKAIGYEFKLVRTGVIDRSPVVVRPVMNGGSHRAAKPENEFACLKCGRDAGVVTVAGHDQCAHCGHIVVGCCGD